MNIDQPKHILLHVCNRFISMRSTTVATLFSLAGIIFIGAGCTAYFNTYYNAEAAYKKARESHKKIMRNYPDSLVVTAPADANTGYERTIEKSIKVIETFTKNKKWHDDALLLMAKSYFYKKEVIKSIRRLKQLQKEFPESPLLPQSVLYLGKAYIEDGNLSKAEEILLAAQQKYPELDNDQEITLLLIEIALRREGKSQAVALLEKAQKTVRSEVQRIDLMVRTAELYIALKQYPKAIALLKKAPRRKDLPFQAYRMDKALFMSYVAIDSLDLALQVINKMISNKQYAIHIDELYFHKALLFKSYGKLDEAIKMLRKLTVGLDSSAVLSDTSSFKAKALVELALLYQKDREDYKKAAEYFNLAAKTRDTASSKFSLRMKTAMERLLQLRNEKDTGTVAGKRIFAIGELFKFDLDEPDSAYNQFISLSRDTVTAPELIASALCFAAEIARDDLHKQKRSDSIYQSVIARFPASDYARIAQEQLHIPVTVKTRADSAREAYRQGEITYYQKNEVKQAIRLFFDIYKSYPELDIAPKSLFAAAWFTSSVLFKNRTAKKLYEKICTKYPESIYCTEQAKPRLKTVIDTLAQLERLRNEQAAKTAKGKGSAEKNRAIEKKQSKPDDDSLQQTDPLSDDEIDSASTTLDTVPAALEEPPATVRYGRGGKPYKPEKPKDLPAKKY